MVEAGEVIETYCCIIAAAPLLHDDALVAEIEAATSIILGFEDESRVILAVHGTVHVSAANMYHQYVCRRGGDKLEMLRNDECQLAAELFRRCHHGIGSMTVKYLSRYEYGLYTDLKELADMAERYGSVQFYGGQLLVLHFRADIAVMLRDYCAFCETMERIREISELTGVFYSETRHLYEPDTIILAADRGKILEGGEAALKACLDQPTPDTGAEASLCEILANVNMDKPDLRRTYLQKMLDASLRDEQLFLASYAAGELALARFNELGSRPAPSSGDRQDLERFIQEWIKKDEKIEDWDASCKKHAILVRLSARFPDLSQSCAAWIQQCLDCAQNFDPSDTRHNSTMIFVVESMVFAWLHPSPGEDPSVKRFAQSAKAWQWVLDWVGEAVHEGHARLGLASTVIRWHTCYPLESDLFPTMALEHLDRAKAVGKSWDDISIRWRAHMLALLVWRPKADEISEVVDVTDAAFRALQELEAAENIASYMRNELSALQGLRAFERKRSFVAESSYQIVRFATQLCYRHLRARPAEFWKWTQYGKARSVSDMLGRSAVMALAAVRDLDADVRELLNVRSQLIQEIETAKPERRFNMRKGLETLHQQLEEIPQLSDVLNIWEGRAVKLASLPEIEATQGQGIVYVDWAEVDDKFVLVTVRRGGDPLLHHLELSIQTVQNWIDLHLNISE